MRAAATRRGRPRVRLLVRIRMALEDLIWKGGKSMHAYVDETGNTGAAIFDAAQPLFITAAMMTRNDFDARFSGEVAAVAARLGVEELHAADLGVGRLEEVAADLLAILRRAGPAFALSRVEKRYHLAGKVIDTLFDPYDNKAVAWQFYNLRPLRMLLVFQVAELLDEPLAGLFWPALMEKRRDRAEAALVSFCRGLAERLDRIDDARLRKVVGDALEWAVENPESFFLVSEDKRQRNGHMPNMVGFGNLIEAIEGQSNRWNRRVETIVHDRQSEFEQSLRFWHRMFTNAKADVVTLPLGEKLVLRKVFGSTLRMSAGVDSAGIQMTDVTLWLFARSLKGHELPPGCARLLAYVQSRAHQNDFSFIGVGADLVRTLDEAHAKEPSIAAYGRAVGFARESEARRSQAMREYADAKAAREVEKR